jgi:hypothetical protein
MFMSFFGEIFDSWFYRVTEYMQHAFFYSYLLQFAEYQMNGICSNIDITLVWFDRHIQFENV